MASFITIFLLFFETVAIFSSIKKECVRNRTHDGQISIEKLKGTGKKYWKTLKTNEKYGNFRNPSQYIWVFFSTLWMFYTNWPCPDPHLLRNVYQWNVLAASEQQIKIEWQTQKKNRSFSLYAIVAFGDRRTSISIPWIKIFRRIWNFLSSWTKFIQKRFLKFFFLYSTSPLYPIV